MEHSVAGILWRLVGILALVCANGFFVSAEFSIITVRKTRIDQLVAEGNRRARAVRRAVSEPDRYIAATQLGITMASLGLGWIGEPALASIIQPELSFLSASIAEATAHSIAVAIAFSLITAVDIVFGELTPKWVALERPEKVAMWVVKPCELFLRALWPFIRVLHAVAEAVVKALGLGKGSSGHAMVHSEEELKMLVTASQEAGVLEEGEEQMLHRVFGFADLTAGQVMVPRTELVGIEADIPADALLETLSRSGYARLPVYRRDIDNVIGILYVTDVVKAIASGDQSVTPGGLAREALTVPETLGADDLLTAMRRRGVHEAVVIDEYGGTAGLVTFGSLVERIVGAVSGPAGGAERITVHADGSADIDGLALVTDLNEQFDLKIDEAVYTTVGGYVLGRLGRRARVGDEIEVEARRMRVVALDGLRVAKVWLSTPKTPPPTEQSNDET
jgi:CBS domain containing-hemolysin-like protein